MSKPRKSLEPLADYLEPHFGNIYEYNVVDAGYDVQEWTDELRESVKQYLLHVAPTQLVEAAFGHPGRDRDKWAERVISHHEPWEIAHELRLETIRAIGTLDELIGHLTSWPYEDERCDAEAWLEHHGGRAVAAGGDSGRARSLDET